MASEGSPICFRVDGRERTLLEAVANSQGQTLSAFVRRSCLDVANALLADQGAETIVSRYEESQRESAERARKRLEEVKADLGLVPHGQSTGN